MTKGIAPPGGNAFDFGNMDTVPAAADESILAKKSGVWTDVPAGANGTFLGVSGGVVGYIALPGGGDMLAATYDPTGKVADAFDLANFAIVGNTQGDLYTRGGAAWERISIGPVGQILTSTGTVAAWQAPSGDMLASVYDSSAIAADAFDLANFTTAGSAPGDLYRRGAGAWERFPIGAAGQVLTSNGSTPDWATSGFVSPVPIVDGGTSATTALDARLALGAAGAIAHNIVLPFALSGTDTPSVSEHGIGSRFEPRLVGVIVDVVTPQNHTNPLQSRVALEILTLAVAGTARLTGDSYDPTTGIVTAADTEDVVISATGFVSSAKLFEGGVSVVISSIGGLDCTLNSFVLASIPTVLGGTTITGVVGNGATTGATNEYRVRIRKYEDGPGITSLFDRQKLNQTSGMPWSDTRVGLGVPVAIGSDIILTVDTQRIAGLSVFIIVVQDNAA